MRLVILPHASLELREAIEYYESEQAGLGERLWDEFDKHLSWIAENALTPRLRSGDYRRVNLRVFPYYIAYAVRGDAIVVLAISHSSRRPEHWVDRS
jgi:plasmid stabilization system protein ParE